MRLLFIHIMKIQEKNIWWTIVTLCTLLQIARIISPSLASQPLFARIQLFALATIISIAVSASVISSSLFGKYENNRNTITSNLFNKQKRLTVTGYKVYYRSQKRVATIFSLIIWSILAFLFRKDELEGDLFCFLLPISFIGPVLYMRDRIKRTNNKTFQIDKQA